MPVDCAVVGEPCPHHTASRDTNPRMVYEYAMTSFDLYQLPDEYEQLRTTVRALAEERIAPWAAEVRRVRKEPVFVPCRARYIMAGPLAAALLTNNLRRVLQLLALGAPLAALSTEGRSPLHTAVWVGNPECLEAVLECICSVMKYRS